MSADTSLAAFTLSTAGGRLARRRNATGLWQLDIDSFAELAPGVRGDADKPAQWRTVSRIFEGSG